MFYVGQEVVCVDAKIHDEFLPLGFEVEGDMDGLAESIVYTIRAIGPYPLLDVNLIWLKEIRRPAHDIFGEIGYDLRRFRPAVKQKTDAAVLQLKKLLNPVTKELESA